MRKNINRAVSLLIIGILFVGGLKLFRYLAVDDTSSYTRIRCPTLVDTM